MTVKDPLSAHDTRLVKTVQYVVLLAAAAGLIRFGFSNAPGAWEMAPQHLYGRVALVAFVLLPWPRWIKTTGALVGFTWLAFLSFVLTSALLYWDTGYAGWWLLPLTSTLFVPAYLSLESGASSPDRFWSMTRGQVWAWVFFVAVGALMWGATTYGPGNATPEAMWMLRMIYMSAVTVGFWVVLFKGMRLGVDEQSIKVRVFLVYLAISLVFMVASNLFHDVLVDNSHMVARRPMSLMTYPVLLLATGLIWRFHHRPVVLSLTVVLGLVWGASFVVINPELSSHTLPSLALMWAVLLRPRQWAVSTLGWGVTVAWFNLGPHVNTDLAFKMSLSSSAIYLLSVWLLGQLAPSGATARTDSPSPTRYPSALSSSPLSTRLKQRMWLAAAAIGCAAPLIGVTVFAADGVAQLQAWILMGLLLGFLVYAGLSALLQSGANENLKKLEDIIEGTEAGTFELDLVKRQARLNHYGAAIFGYPKEPNHIQTDDEFDRLIHPDDAPAYDESLQRCLNGVTPLHKVEYRIRKPSGEQVWVQERARISQRDHRNAPTLLTGTLFDVTSIKEAEQAHREARRAAELADQAKLSFLSNMSHDMRTPLNALLGYTQLLTFSPLSPAQKNDVAKMQTAGRHLLGLINNILDFSKLTSGGFQLNPEPFKLSPLLNETVALILPMAQAKGLDVSMEPLPPALEGVWVGDPQRLSQVFLNLLSNAVKFTDTGAVRMVVSAGQASPSTSLRLQVMDTGVGISPDELPRLFQRFSQLHNTATRNHVGTGLGLAIVKEIVHAMNGQVEVTSTLGQGSTFTVEIPLIHATPAQLKAVDLQQPIGAAAPMSLKGVNVLVVDDNAMNLDVCSSMLERHGAQVLTAFNGAQALERLFETPDPVHLVLMDVHMPVMDGLTAATQIRQHPRWQEVPIVALSAGASDQDMQNALAVGMQEYLLKPFEEAQLLRVMAKWLPEVSTSTNGPSPQGEATGLPTAEAAQWRPIHGLALDNAQRLLGNDWTMFMRQLLATGALMDRLHLDRPVADDPDAMTAMAHHVHKLIGNFSVLGAEAMVSSMRQLEKNLKAFDRDAANAARQDVRSGWDAIVAASAPAIGAYRIAHRRLIEQARSSEITPLSSEVSGLLDALNKQRFSALRTYNRMRHGLHAHLTDEVGEQLDVAIDTGAFAEAADLIRKHLLC